MRWVGLNGGYVSGDGRFLVAQVTVKGKRGDMQKWALYGLVRLSSEDPLRVAWGWTERPLFGPVATKRACQEWAASSDYQPVVEVALDQASPQMPASKRIAWEICQECGVDFERPRDHPYLDYCGKGCFEVVCDRVDEIRSNLGRRRAS